jgi:hypothetical protein
VLGELIEQQLERQDALEGGLPRHLHLLAPGPIVGGQPGPERLPGRRPEPPLEDRRPLRRRLAVGAGGEEALADAVEQAPQLAMGAVEVAVDPVARVLIDERADQDHDAEHGHTELGHGHPDPARQLTVRQPASVEGEPDRGRVDRQNPRPGQAAAAAAGHRR